MVAGGKIELAGKESGQRAPMESFGQPMGPASLPGGSWERFRRGFDGTLLP